ncbi:hypothetical protein H310_04921 [Aphanomyces invadans]|uniref:Uncharacterized protein n=1 Tax=Aphanomyces invadans TaxID=157072 RepID=A0A024UBB0_9STRA|nr:hypothetical protein H310_04921 [Aphanomyces invadans]ETW03465.1 hypothetical protein H310_04921 [Aphanomyces invadans]|eukprot:XP_008867694.1 hypothetical protein H310_04921 [Aphanomyces invadans]
MQIAADAVASTAPTPSMFEQGQVLLMQLQHLGHALRHHQPNHATLLRAVISAMRLVRECVNKDLANEFGHNLASKTSAYVSKLIQRCQDDAGITCPDAACVRADRSALVHQELKAIDGLANSPFFLSPRTQGTLRDIVKYLRRQEETRSFHVQLLECQLKSTSTYAVSTFAYGSTPLFTWIDLFKTPLLTDCVARIQAAPHPSACTLFGSSTGSLVFYTALLCKTPFEASKSSHFSRMLLSRPNGASISTSALLLNAKTC